jgi:hypothetical protein
MIGELAFAQQLSRGLQVFLPEPRVASENRRDARLLIPAAGPVST